MEDWITIRNLKKRNPTMGTRSIAKQLDLSRNTVKNALRSEDPPEYKRKTYTNPELQPFQEYIIEQYFVKKLKGIGSTKVKGTAISDITPSGINMVEAESEFKQNFGFTVNLGLIQINWGAQES